MGKLLTQNREVFLIQDAKSESKNLKQNSGRPSFLLSVNNLYFRHSLVCC